jgi:hypothetical protein
VAIHTGPRLVHDASASSSRIPLTRLSSSYSKHVWHSTPILRSDPCRSECSVSRHPPIAIAAGPCASSSLQPDDVRSSIRLMGTEWGRKQLASRDNAKHVMRKAPFTRAVPERATGLEPATLTLAKVIPGKSVDPISLLIPMFPQVKRNFTGLMRYHASSSYV